LKVWLVYESHNRLYSLGTGFCQDLPWSTKCQLYLD